MLLTQVLLHFSRACTSGLPLAAVCVHCRHRYPFTTKPNKGRPCVCLAGCIRLTAVTGSMPQVAAIRAPLPQAPSHACGLFPDAGLAFQLAWRRWPQRASGALAPSCMRDIAALLRVGQACLSPASLLPRHAPIPPDSASNLS
ncbi:MAG: hypothetical protein J3K34DRAFT_427041 [Monoraphidium minutum]|nr:MAG: hypothetical protein J3K34DRAFT_427041 [Monoraphidium minutum]